jgi:hypothetical protein
VEQDKRNLDLDSEEGRRKGETVPPPPTDGEITWSPEAWARVQNAPLFVRRGIKKLMVRRAKECGCKVITSDFLTEMRNSSMMKVSRRLHRFGFTSLSPEAFEVAKEKMRRRPRRVEVIEDIQDHLARRKRKNQKIISLFKKFMASMSQIKR